MMWVKKGTNYGFFRNPYWEDPDASSDEAAPAASNSSLSESDIKTSASSPVATSSSVPVSSQKQDKPQTSDSRSTSGNFPVAAVADGAGVAILAVFLSTVMLRKKKGSQSRSAISAEDIKPEKSTENFCSNCGSPIPANSKFCSQCGKEIE